jgi:hypothetical protein
MMRFLVKLLSVFSLLALVATAQAQTPQVTDVAGVKFPNEIDVRGTKLVLNGAGVRTRVIVKVYAVGIYLPRKAGNLKDIAAMPGAKRIHLQMLREVEGDQFGSSFSRAVGDNTTKDEFAKFVGTFMRMGQIFAAKPKLVAGETVSIDFTPGTGTQIFINAKPAGEPFKEPEFFAAMLKVWLGERPVDTTLRPLLLGEGPVQAAPRESNN